MPETRTVLLVEDDEDQQRSYGGILAEALSSESIRVDWSTTVADALNKVESLKEELFLIVIDLKIPLTVNRAATPYGGEQLLDRIEVLARSGRVPRDLPIIVISRARPPDVVPARVRWLQRIKAVEKTDFNSDYLKQVCSFWGLAELEEARLPEALQRVKMEDSAAATLEGWFDGAFLESVHGETDSSLKVDKASRLLSSLRLAIQDDLWRRMLSENERVYSVMRACLEKLQAVLRGAYEPSTSAEDPDVVRKARLDVALLAMLRAEVAHLHLRHFQGLGDLVQAIRENVTGDRLPLGSGVGEAFNAARRILSKAGRRLDGERVWAACLRLFAKKAVDVEATTPVECERKLQELRKVLAETGRGGEVRAVEGEICRVRRRRLRGTRRLWFTLLQYTCEYGNSPGRLLLWCLGVLVIFSIIYLPTPECLADVIPPFLRIEFRTWPYDGNFGTNIVTAFYFSVTTFVTLGYGDMAPTNVMGRLVCPLEAFLGYSVLGLLIAILTDRIRPA